MKKWVSDKITDEEIQKWNKGDIITVRAGTGYGKSHFIKHKLFKHADLNNGKILMLIHRKDCITQFRKEIKEEGRQNHIHVQSYQSIEAKVRDVGYYDFSHYSYIVCDEFHYFIQDASFNNYTDLSLNAVLDQKDKIKIFTSATGDYMTQYFEDYRKYKIRKYNFPINYDFIRFFEFFHKEDSLEELIQDFISKDQKAIVFVNDIRKAVELYRRFKDHSLFNCSGGSNPKEYKKYVDEDKITKMLEDDQKFHEKILITTTVMEAGVSIKDPELHNIVIYGVYDTGTLIQCIGRKRIDQDSDDYINLYIKSKNNNQLGYRKTHLNKMLEKADYFKKHGQENYIKEYSRDNDKSNIIYDEMTDDKQIHKKRNDMIYFRYKVEISEIDEMIQLGSYGYCKYLANKFGCLLENGLYDYSVYEKRKGTVVFKEYLEEIEGKKLFKDDQEKLSNLIINELISRKIDSRTKILKPSTMESIIRTDFQLHFAVDKPKNPESKGINRGKRYIVVYKLS